MRVSHPEVSSDVASRRTVESRTSSLSSVAEVLLKGAIGCQLSHMAAHSPEMTKDDIKKMSAESLIAMKVDLGMSWRGVMEVKRYNDVHPSN